MISATPLPDLRTHPLRDRLNEEFHARPAMPLSSPVVVSHFALIQEAGAAAAERQRLRKLAEAGSGQVIAQSETHLIVESPDCRLCWEKHTEFSSYTLFRALAADVAACTGQDKPQTLLPAWLSGVPGELIVATRVKLLASQRISPESVTAGLSPTGRQMVGARVADRAAWVFTDFTVDDTFSDFLIIDDSLTPRQAARTVQRLLDIETYRLLALLALPVAREIGGWLGHAEEQLAELVDRIGQAQSPTDEREVLAELTRLAAKVEHSIARTTFRFGAARAYHALVMQRIGELREQRVTGCPTFHEIMQRRLLPAMQTCIAMAARQEELSGRLARTGQLLRTRVEVELERQNQEQLAQMNRRARLQLRLQETVEGLSVVAITYYASQLVHYLAKGASTILPWLSPELTTAVSIPLIAGASVLGIHRMRSRLRAEEDAGGST
ncbi:DUF3422 family protein [Accumulibacter sp.]|uniref:DUF3422 family protein n=1 Tax=Accumulibacter sp. TaxID=2053492 RepID=UPI0025CE68CF|nr:DUF3422 domain-containing protein [Accumulibacter sp.]MCM8594959.1 DUF3422 domain-containing protein [Accumulibacter sp.]MCM8624356.1 DUF3422 domain-containing protein [Accumulibacter sp.]MDS4049105.1 DUF3422 domain-containing protein [Accumulibacter sp.]